MGDQGPLVFSLDADRDFAARVAKKLGVRPGDHEERDFGDGEHKVRPLESVRGRDIYLVQSLYGDRRLGVNDRLIRLLFLTGALRDAGAARITAVIPYLAYARKDRRTRPRDPVTTRYMAQLFEAMRVDRLAALDVHNPAAFENAFRCPAHALSARQLLAEHVTETLPTDRLCVASPDVGGLKRSEAFRETLESRIGEGVTSAFVDKSRSEGKVSGRDLVAGRVRDRNVILLDDLIASGATMTRAARTFLEQGARSVHAVATHGIFSKKSDDILATGDLASISVTDTVPPWRISTPAVRDKMRVLDVTARIAREIRHLHDEEEPGED